MIWNYAELSKEAKKCGGPEALVAKLIQSGFMQGKKSMHPVVGGALAVGAVVGTLIWEGGKFLCKKIVSSCNHNSDAGDIQAAREELIKGIKDFETERGYLDEDKTGEGKEAKPKCHYDNLMDGNEIRLETEKDAEEPKEGALEFSDVLNHNID